MQSAKLLHNLLDNSCQSIDKRITRTLFQASETLMHCKKLSIVSLGRSLDRGSKTKHNIKCMDRLFGNSRLHKKIIIFYRAMSDFFLKNNKQPIILIDWSRISFCGTYHFIRASLAVEGRAITIYEECVHMAVAFKPYTQDNFLLNLKNILPKYAIPIIVTDAGFRNTWFESIVKLGWDFAGRVRNTTKYRLETEIHWKPIKSLYAQASKKSVYIGKVLLAQNNPLNCHFYLAKLDKKYRINKNLSGEKVRCSSSLKHEERENEPWLIATSLSSEQFSPDRVINLYKKRMQIEESFRDLKNARNGFSFNDCRSFSAPRLNVALLIATLATFLLWLIGNIAKKNKLHYSFQTNTIKHRNVLSIVMIGWQVIEKGLRMGYREIKLAIKNIADFCMEVCL